MALVSPQIIFQHLIYRGVSAASAAGILANIAAESNFNTAAIGDGGTSFGLFQHHGPRGRALKEFARKRGMPWTDWRVQVDFALQEARQMGLNLNHTDPRKAAYEWTVRFERPANTYVEAGRRAAQAGNYLYPTPGGYPAGSSTLHGLPAGTSGVGTATYTAAPVGDPVAVNWAAAPSATGAPGSGQGELNLPTGGTFIKVGNRYIVAYRFHGVQGGPTSVVYYQLAGKHQIPKGARVVTMSEQRVAEFRASGNWVDGGSVEALRGTPKGTSYQELVDDVLIQLGLAGTEALRDGGVMNIIAIAMTREMSEQELENRLRKTDYWKKRTDRQREWDDLSEAEKNQRIVDSAANLAQQYFYLVGVDLNLAAMDLNKDGRVSADEIKKANPTLYQWAFNVASGKSTEMEAQEAWIKKEARKNPNSPWSRTLREEEKAQRQHQVDIANTAEQIRDLYWEWGLPITDRKAMQLAEQVVMNQKAMADIESMVRDQANAQYPHKPKNMSTRQWAQPYMDMYMSVLESPEVDLQDKLIQRALKQGMTLSDFNKMLRADDRWLNTQNARDEMFQTIGQLGRVMGF